MLHCKATHVVECVSLHSANSLASSSIVTSSLIHTYLSHVNSELDDLGLYGKLSESKKCLASEGTMGMHHAV